MMTRRDLLKLWGATTAATACPQAWAVDRLAWEKPIGLEVFTLRDTFFKDPAETLKQVAAVGYKEVEIIAGVWPAALNPCLRSAELTAVSGYFDPPASIEDWKKTVELGREYGLRYLVVGDNPRLDLEAWKRRADFFNQCGDLSHGAGIQFCYHAHYNEFARADGACAYDILLAHCDPKLLQMEMDVFWADLRRSRSAVIFPASSGRDSPCCTSRISIWTSR